MLRFIQAISEAQQGYALTLLREYASSLDFDLDFQNFKQELTCLPQEYAPPDGRLLLAMDEEDGTQIAGCIALRKLNKDTCEMKRLYVRPAFRSRGIGKGLALTLIEEAHKIGYTSMRLDTVSSMKEAIALYHALGFTEIEPYRYNPLKDALFMELTLSSTEVENTSRKTIASNILSI